jgi:CRISPR-associated endonuclease/helicase Cas3
LVFDRLLAYKVDRRNYTMGGDDFNPQFESLTGNAPFPWQVALYARFCRGDFPSSCDLPTGLGKTSVIPIWLLALATAPERVPRRLVYVVNRRTVVDQASDEARKVREQIDTLPDLKNRLELLCVQNHDTPLGISTLRGQLADNGEWCRDPARPSIIIGTVDMIGSRLLFSGYGRGFKSRPLHAGFLAQDTLLVHDEAHLEPAFQQLLKAISDEQKRCKDFRGFQIVELSATSRGSEKPFRLTDEDKSHPIVLKRINATKNLALHEVSDSKSTADRIAQIAIGYQDSGRAILVFMRTLKDMATVAGKLKGQSVQRLTGTLRGLERDRLARTDPIFARFLPKPTIEPETKVEPKPGTVYLLCTSAGEVGVNISADDLVCDLTPFDSMAQRFGRVNRFGNRTDTRIDVVHPAQFDDGEYELRRKKTLVLLRELGGSGSPQALSSLDIDARWEAFTPDPVFVDASDILFDSWALTTIRQPLPGRPPVADYLHGIPTDWEPPQTQVAWRWDVELIAGDLLDDYRLQNLLDEYPLKPHELLRDQSARVFKELETLAKAHAEAPVWLIDDEGEIESKTLGELINAGKEIIEDKTLLLPPSIGGLTDGMLDGNAPHNAATHYDVADEWRDSDDQPLRYRIEAVERGETPTGMRPIREIVLEAPSDGSESEEIAPSGRTWLWYVRPADADDDGSKSARFDQLLADHLNSAEGFAEGLARKLCLNAVEATAVRLAAKWHDLGKDRKLWQNSIGNRGPQSLAKSKGRMRSVDLSSYRHEYGSLLDLCKLPEFAAQPDDVKELVLHLVAAHHGRGRPHFPQPEVFDPKHPQREADALSREVPRRFARLQRKYGRWGLAWLESLVRAADVLASQPPEGVQK